MAMMSSLHHCLHVFQGSGGQRRAGDSYLSTVSDTLLTREAGKKTAVGGVLGSKPYTGMELSGVSEIEVGPAVCVCWS